jgi:hypothetical protein
MILSRIEGGDIMVAKRHFSKTPEKYRFSRTPEQSPFERVGLFIIGVFLLLFAIELVETETMAESLSAFHWILH